jgi:hypothetical protein
VFGGDWTRPLADFGPPPGTRTRLAVAGAVALAVTALTVFLVVALA